MKKHIIMIMNIVLVALIVAGAVYTVIRMIGNDPSDPEPQKTAPDQPTYSHVSTEDEATPDEPAFRIGIVQHGLGKDSEFCYDGFKDQLSMRKLIDNFEIEYVVENSDEKCIEAIGRLVDEKVDLLYTIGPFASRYAAEATDEIPIVFAAVTDPEEMNLVESNANPGGNITGVSSYTPCFEQIDLIPILLPKTDSVAAIYNATDVNAVRQAIIACGEAEDFEYTADRYAISDTQGVFDALEDIYDKGTDVIYLPIDRLIRDNLETIIEFSQEHDIPIICGNRAMMTQGCLATCEINYTSIGRRAADLCCEILFNEKDPAELSVIYKYDCDNYVNKQVLEQLGIELSDVAKANVMIVDCAQ